MKNMNLSVPTKPVAKGRIVICNPDGSDEKVFPFNSCTKAFVQWLQYFMTYKSTGTILCADGVKTYAVSGCIDFNNNQYSGITIATDVSAQPKTQSIYSMGTPFDSADWETFIPQLSYKTPSESISGKMEVWICRNFRNKSSASINVKEVGITQHVAIITPPSLTYGLYAYDQINVVDDEVLGVDIGVDEVKTFRIEIIIPDYCYNFNMARHLARLQNNVAPNLINVDGSTQTNALDISSQASCPDGNDTYGLLVGGDDTAWTYNRYNLYSKFLATELYPFNYTVSQELQQKSDGTFFFEIQRTFRNVSGSEKTIKEIGVFGKYSADRMMLYRRALPSGQWITLQDQEETTISVSFDANFEDVGEEPIL